MIQKKPHALIVSLLAALALLVLPACGSTGPATVPAAPPTAQPAQPAQPTLPPVVETVVVKETIVVKQTVVTQPTAAPSDTPTATVTPTPTKAPVVAPVATKRPAQGAKLDFTADDIEYGATTRTGDNKVQLTITLHPRGGVAPFNFVLDPGGVETKVKGLTFTFAWHNCNQWEPHSIVLYSADGQTVGPVHFQYNGKCQ